MKKVFLVDDEQTIIDGLKVLVDWNARELEVIGEASNGDDALSLILQMKPDIVLTDIRMPGLDGLELITHLKNRRIECQIIIISGYDDFNYCLSALRAGVCDYILKPIDFEVLGDKLDKAIHRIDSKEEYLSQKDKHVGVLEDYKRVKINSQLKDIITGINDFTRACRRLREMGIKGKLFIVCVTNAGMDAYDFNSIMNKNTFNEDIDANICLEYPDFFHHLMVDNNHVFVIGYEETTEILAKSFRVLMEFQKRHSDLTFGVGNSYPLEDLRNSFNEAKQAMEEQIYNGNGCIYHINNVSIDRNYSYYPKFDIEELLNYIKYGDSENVFKILEKIFKEFEIQRPSRNEIYVILNEIIVVACGHLLGLLEDNDGLMAMQSEWLSHLKTLNALEEYKNYMKKVLSQIMTRVSTLNEKMRNARIIEIKEYIEEHYSEDLNLSLLGQKFHMNPNYFSRFFKQNMRVNFLEYLNNIRIRKAKEQLAKSHLSITEIADMVGFSSYRYFTRVFKKQTGMTPNKYRKTLVNDDNKGDAFHA